MRILILLVSIFTLNSYVAFAQVNSMDSRFTEVDAHVSRVSKQFVFHPQALAQKLIENQSNDYDKVRAFYVWIAKNVEYDFLAYIHNSNSSESIQEITRSGKALCSGFSLLFSYFCEQASIEAVIIEGYAKGYGYKKGQKFHAINHAWNAVNIYGRWYLIDATWATGNPTNLAKHEKKIDPNTYFLTDPKIFIQTHLPEDPTWQLLDQKIALKEFEGDHYDNNSSWPYNSYSPDDYSHLNEYDRDLLYYKRALAFSKRSYSLSTSLSFAYLYKGISLTDDLWQMEYSDLCDSLGWLEKQFSAYMDSAWHTIQKPKSIQFLKYQRIINDEVNYQKGVFNYELAVEVYSKSNIQDNIAQQAKETVEKYFSTARDHFREVKKTSIYFTDANEYLTFIQEFRQRYPVDLTND